LPHVSPIELRLDAAVPDQVHLNRSFDLAVAVRHPSSPALAEDDLPRVRSGDLQVAWPETEPYINLRLQVSAPDCGIHDADSRSFRLYSAQDSPVFYFHLTPKKRGKIGIIVTVFQEDVSLGGARVHTLARDEVVGRVLLDVTSYDFHPNVDDVFSLYVQSNEVRENLRLIQERKSQYVLEEDIPLQLIKNERQLLRHLTQLEQQIDRQGTN
jgi:hypothetical protein